jgi:hypothetical protein
MLICRVSVGLVFQDALYFWQRNKDEEGSSGYLSLSFASK